MKFKTTIEELEKIVNEKYPFIKGICIFRKNNATYGRFYDPNKESGKGSYNEPYEWRRDHILKGNITIEDHSWNKERADKYVLKKYPYLKYCGQYLNSHGDAIMQYYDENIENDEKGSLNNPYTFQAKHLDEYFTIGEKIWSKERFDSYIHKFFPMFHFIKVEHIKRNHADKDGKIRTDSFGVYYNPSKEEGYGSINNPYYFDIDVLTKDGCSLKGKRIGEVICEEMINTFTNNYDHDKAKMKGTQLRPDFTLYDYNTYIEVNGAHHYVDNIFETDNLKEKKNRDDRKIEYAKNNNWNIIVLPNPYDVNVPKDEKIQVYLSNEKGLEVLEKLKNSGYNSWFEKFDISIN